MRRNRPPAPERVTAAERAGLDLAELARRVRELAYLRGLEGPDRPIPPGSEGAHLSPGQREAVLALAELAEHLAAELWEGEDPLAAELWEGEDPPSEPGPADVAEAWRRLAAGPPPDLARGWRVVRLTGPGCHLVVVVPRG